MDEAKALAAIEDEIRQDFGHLGREQVRERRWRNCAIPNTQPSDFTEHLIDLGGGLAVICGIRHLGMNIEKPFVLLCPNFPLVAEAEIHGIYESHLRHLFEVFHPKWIQVYTNSDLGSHAGGSLFLVARASEVVKSVGTDDPVHPSLEFVEPPDDDYYDWYSETYDAFHAEFPDKKDLVQKNDLDLMIGSREAGLLRLAAIGGERVGLIAAERESFLGHDGIYFVDILVVKQWRGRGLGKRLQRLFTEQLCGPDEIVWGLIDRTNQASLKTALANGRRVVRSERFLRV